MKNKINKKHEMNIARSMFMRRCKNSRLKLKNRLKIFLDENKIKLESNNYKKQILELYKKRIIYKYKPIKKRKKKKEFEILIRGDFRNIFINDKQLSYDKYLRTNHWRKKRKRILELYYEKCFDCNDKAIDVHHLTYENIGEEKDDDLIPLCIKCHSIRHQL